MKTSLQAWTKSSSAIEKFGKVAQLDELGEEFLEETVREQIAGELA